MEKNKIEERQQANIPTDIQMLIAGFIPNAKHFDSRFDLMQVQTDGLKHGQDEMKERIDRLEKSVDRRFEQVDKRFDQVDRRFEQVIASIDRLGDKLDARDDKQRGFTIRMFTVAVSISMIGVFGAFLKSLGII